MLDVSYSLSLLPQDRNGGGLDELAMPLLITGTLDAYLERHGELAAERLLSFFALDPDNPASIYSCLAAARASAHAVRGRITLDMWENINATWLEMRGIAAEGILRYGISRFCEWVKDRSHLFRGATFATSMRNDAFRFIRLGTFIERADNTLRLLDARYQTQGEAALAGADEGTARGYYQWSALLRALSAFEGYTELYRASPNARNIAELLLLREDVPRSLLSCIEELSEILSGLPGVNGRPAQRLAAELEARVRYTGIDEVLEQACIPGSPTTSCWFASWPTPFTAPTWRPHETLDHPRHHLSLRRPGARQHPVPAPDPAGQRAPARGRLASGPAAPGAALRDPYGNILHVLTLDEPHESVLIAAHGLVEIDEEREVEHDRQSPLPFLRSTRLTGADAEMRAFAERAMGGRKDRGGLLDLMHGGCTSISSTSRGRPASTAPPSRLSAHAPGSARTMRMPSSPASAARACRGATSPATSTPRTIRTWPAMPGPRPGSATAGTARRDQPARPSGAPSQAGRRPRLPGCLARCAACAVAAVASRCMRGCWSARRRCRCSNSDDPLRAWRYRRLPLRLRGGDGRNKEDSR